MNDRWPRYWTRDLIVARIREWAHEHGEPPRAIDWARATPRYPSRPTVEGVFGKWNHAIEAAGFDGRPSQAPGPHKPWSRDRIAEAFLDFVAREGRWPTATDCGVWRGRRVRRDPRLPAWRTVYRRFPTWDAAKLYAGWDPDASARPVPTDPGCASCGGELDNITIGCAACHDRQRRKRERAAARNAPAVNLPVAQAGDTRARRRSQTAGASPTTRAA